MKKYIIGFSIIAVLLVAMVPSINWGKVKSKTQEAFAEKTAKVETSTSATTQTNSSNSTTVATSTRETATKSDFIVNKLTRGVYYWEATNNITDLINKSGKSTATPNQFTDSEINDIIDYLKTIKHDNVNQLTNLLYSIYVLCNKYTTTSQYNTIYGALTGTSVSTNNDSTNNSGKSNGGANTNTNTNTNTNSNGSSSNSNSNNGSNTNNNSSGNTDNSKITADFMDGKSVFNILNGLRKSRGSGFIVKGDDLVPNSLPSFHYAGDLSSYAQQRAKYCYLNKDYTSNHYNANTVCQWYGMPKDEVVVRGSGNLNAEATNMYKNNKVFVEPNIDNWVGVGIYGTPNDYVIVVIVASIKK